MLANIVMPRMSQIWGDSKQGRITPAHASVAARIGDDGHHYSLHEADHELHIVETSIDVLPMKISKTAIRLGVRNAVRIPTFIFNGFSNDD